VAELRIAIIVLPPFAVEATDRQRARMDDPHDRILAELSGTCSDATFIGMCCQVFAGKLTLRVHPNGRTISNRGITNGAHLAMHGESNSQQAWWQSRVQQLGWY
jgi:hypothetical protein